jgi:DNA-3-methyladenine glycosylase
VTVDRRAAALPVAFFRSPADAVARALLGTVMVSTIGGVRTAGRIVETEAYLGTADAASHGFSGRATERTAALFGPPGMWYVYRSYGIHWCCNLVCEREGIANAVLVRALEPLEGLDVMRERRSGVSDRALCAGPGRLCAALGITRALDGAMMHGSDVRVYRGDSIPDELVAATPRIGITRAAEEPLRFVVRGSRWVSGKVVRR